MADERIILQADLRGIERDLDVIHGDLGSLHGDLNVIDDNVGVVNNNVKAVYDDVGKLARDFYEYVKKQEYANRLAQAKIDIVGIRQEIEKKYGHYDVVRRTTTGILQADDLAIVKKSTISNATEQIMIETPGYWLAPCLVALAAWINDQPEIADRALMEGIRRDDEKTSLFFALVCRRADRKGASLKWLQRFLAGQDEENLDRKTVIILDAFASGLFGADSEGVVSKQMSEWLDHLSSTPGFVEKQIRQWSDAINLKRQPLSSVSYPFLRKYSKTWPILQDILEGANLHAEMLNYLIGVFEQKTSNQAVKAQLDEILDSLVTDFDDEEIPLRKQEHFESLVIKYKGDEARASSDMAVEERAFETHKDFTELLTEAAMNPETAHASISTQKFSFALCKDWVTQAYNDIVGQNRMKIPYEIEINVDSFNDKTIDGQNENEMIQRYNDLVDSELQSALSQYVLTGFDQFCLYGGGIIALIGIVMIVMNNIGLGAIAVIAGLGLIINHFSKKKKIRQNCAEVERHYKEKRENGIKIIRATLAEVVDYWIEFAQKDGESQQVLDFLEQISPDQYVKKLASSNRRIKIQGGI